MTGWFHDPAFWRGCRDLLFDDSRMAGAPAEVDWIVGHTGVELPAPVLDLCCGVGRHARAFAARGFAVTGVDLETTYLEEAKADGLELVHGDMRTFRREGAFDLAVNLFTSFGYFDDPADDRAVLENVFASLRPGGRFVLELKGKENLARVFQPIRAVELPDGAMLVMRSTLEGDWEYCRSPWTRFASGEREVYTMRTRLYSATELRALLEGVGFGEVAFFGSLAGDPFDHVANRTVAVARR